MSQELINKAQAAYLVKRPDVKVGDSVVVHTIIRDGDKKRIQKFEGMVIAIKGASTDKMFTVRKISYGIGVEKIFPLYSPNVDKIEVLKHSKVRRAKLYYMRDRIGKAAMKLKPGAPVITETGTPEPEEIEAVTPEEVAASQEEVVTEQPAEEKAAQ